jgi:hypothetical protein
LLLPLSFLFEKQKIHAETKRGGQHQLREETPEYKKEVAAALEERRKRNEPLNKAALEKMLRVYTPDAVRYFYSPSPFTPPALALSHP